MSYNKLPFKETPVFKLKIDPWSKDPALARRWIFIFRIGVKIILIHHFGDDKSSKRATLQYLLIII